MASPGGYLLEDAHSCPICQQIVVDVGERYQSHDLAKLGAGAPPDERESCELYRQVSRAREDAPDVHLHLQIVRFKSRTSPLTAIIRNGRRDFDPDEVDLGYTYHVYADEGDLAMRHVPYCVPGMDVSSDRVFKVARQWLRSCVYGHIGCPTPKRIPLPSRVICVSSQSIKLLTSENGRPEHGRYAALSYCWGAPQPMSTTRANLAAYMDTIPYDGLPQTIKDAVIVTRGLGLDYLWIDALCIVQDDEDDRSKELPLMAQTYNSSYVTISASTAATCLDGFLAPRKTENRSIRLPARCRNGKMSSVLLVQDFSEGEDDAYPINTRAWTMQEHLLAPRLLVFGPTRVRMMCLSKTRFDGGFALPPHMQQAGMPQFGASTLFAAKYGVMSSPNLSSSVNGILTRTGLMKVGLKYEGGQHENLQSLAEHWGRVVEAYTSRNLGFASDRLPAISGMAEMLHRPELGDYLAGLYATGLHAQLVWRRAEKQQPLKRPDEYRAPSWSWAGIDGTIEFPADFVRAGRESLARILECKVIPRSEREKYIAFHEGGVLRICGRTASATFPVDSATGRLQLPPGMPELTMVEDAAAVWPTADVELLLLEVLQYYWVSHGILLRTLENDTNTYTRVGYIYLEGPSVDAMDSWKWEEVTVV